jgi:tetratricopeptide (TPR) repeat protein
MQKVAAPVAPAEPQPPNAPTDPPPRGADAEDGTLALGSSGLGEAELAIEAMTNFRLADTALQRNDLASAARLAQKAIDADPSQAEYRALLAWVQALQSNNEAAFGEAVEAITALLQEDPSSDRGLLYRGRLHKKLGNMEDALADFEGVLTLTPNNREAQNEVRALKKK